MKKIFTLALAVAALLTAPGLTNAQTCADLYGPDYVLLRFDFTSDDYPLETSFELRNACTGEIYIPDGYYYLPEPNTDYYLEFCALNTDHYEFIIHDAFGDGMCCAYGNGSYSVTFDGVVVGSGGEFGASESTFFGASGPCPPPPANDLCADALALSCGDVVSGTTYNATTETETFCGTDITSPGVWYKFTGDGSVVTVSTCSFANYDSKISIFTGTCGALNCVAGNDDFCGLQTSVSGCTTAGTEYYILVHGYFATGNFELTVTCGGELSAGTIFVPSPICNGDDAYLELFGNTPGASLQWQESSTSGGPYTDIAGETFAFYYDPAVTSSTYYVVNATCGSATATSSEAAVTPSSTPANDNICNAQALTLGVVTSFDNSCATVASGEPSPGAGSGANSCGAQDGWCAFETALQNTVWFKFTTPASRAVSIQSTFDAFPFDTQLALWSSDAGCSGTLTKVAANDDTPNPSSFFDFSSAILPVYCLKPNATYYVQVDGFGGMVGSGLIRVREEDNKVLVCHRSADGKTSTLWVAGCSLASHLAHGDTRGDCGAAKTDETIMDESSIEDATVASYVQAYPNPFNDKTTIEFGTDKAADKVTLEVFNVTGQKVATLFEGSMGENEMKKVDFIPAGLNAQVFVYVLRTDSDVRIGKLNMAK